MYRAIKEIGGYKIGEIVPDKEAELWLEMYKIPQVEKVDEKVLAKEKSKKVEKKQESSFDNILEDYLGRNQSVVKKNLSEDKLSKHQLEELLRLEESDKKRPLIISAIKKILKIN